MRLLSHRLFVSFIVLAFVSATADAMPRPRRLAEPSPEPAKSSWFCPRNLVLGGALLAAAAGFVWTNFSAEAPKPVAKGDKATAPVEEPAVAGANGSLDDVLRRSPTWKLDKWPEVAPNVRVRIVMEMHHTKNAVARRAELKARAEKKEIRLLIEGIEKDQPSAFFEDPAVRGYSDLAILLLHGLTSGRDLTANDRATLVRDLERLARDKATATFLWPDAIRNTLEKRLVATPAERPVFEAIDKFFREVVGANDVEAAVKTFTTLYFDRLYGPANRKTTQQYQRIVLAAASGPVKRFVKDATGDSLPEDEYAAVDNYANNLGAAMINPDGPGRVEVQVLNQLVEFCSRYPRDYGMFVGVLEAAKSGEPRDIDVIVGRNHAFTLYRALHAAAPALGRDGSWVTLDLSDAEAQIMQTGDVDPSMRVTSAQARRIYLHLVKRAQEIESGQGADRKAP